MKQIVLSLAILFSAFAGFAQPAGDCSPWDDGTLYPDAQYCNIFWRCGLGETVREVCPDGLYFNPFAMVCDYPESSGCEGSVDPGGSSGGGSHSHANCIQGDNGNCVHRPCTVTGCNVLVDICERTSGVPICLTVM